MLRTTHVLLNYTLRATDKDLGSVKDFYFDDESWKIRYLIADTGNWLPGRQVLIGTETLGQPDWSQEVFPIHLTAEQIEKSPDIRENAPVSLQQEDKLRAYYSWQRYWGDKPFIQPAAGETFGLVGVTPAPEIVPPDVEAAIQVPTGDQHLRSMNEVCGYSLNVRDGAIGHVEDFVMDDSTWQLHYIIVNTGNWLPGKKVLIAPEWITQVNWPDQTVDLELTEEGVKNSPEFDPALPINREYESRLYDYYGRPKYWS
ncbi:PRC-barrel domain-containing protein [Nitrospira sp. M1]